MKIINVNEASYRDICIALFLNGEDVSSRAWRARVPEKHGVLGFGWADIYDLSKDGGFLFDEEAQGPTWRRRYGLVKTTPKP